VDGYTKDKETARQQVKEQENLISLIVLQLQVEVAV
jgi:hypothetical protein